MSPPLSRRRLPKPVGACVAVVGIGLALGSCGDADPPAVATSAPTPPPVLTPNPVRPEVAVGQAAGCEAAEGGRKPTAKALGWPDLGDATRIRCEDDTSAYAIHVRFENQVDLRKDLATRADPRPACLVGDEVYLAGLGREAFAKLCTIVGGAVVDGVSDLPELPAKGERGERLEKQRNARVQARAIRAYWNPGG